MKLLRAHLADAVPLDLLRQEQDRLTHEISQAEQALTATALRFEQIEETLSQALELAANCEDAYRLAPAKLRRQFNQAFFRKLLVVGEDVIGSELAEPFAQLLTHDLIERLQREMANPALSTGRGSNEELLVPPTRIELVHAV